MTLGWPERVPPNCHQPPTTAEKCQKPVLLVFIVGRNDRLSWFGSRKGKNKHDGISSRQICN